MGYNISAINAIASKHLGGALQLAEWHVRVMALKYYANRVNRANVWVITMLGLYQNRTTIEELFVTNTLLSMSNRENYISF